MRQKGTTADARGIAISRAQAVGPGTIRGGASVGRRDCAEHRLGFDHASQTESAAARAVAVRGCFVSMPISPKYAPEYRLL